jgi:hypothetical protein
LASNLILVFFGPQTKCFRFGDADTPLPWCKAAAVSRRDDGWWIE